MRLAHVVSSTMWFPHVKHFCELSFIQPHPNGPLGVPSLYRGHTIESSIHTTCLRASLCVIPSVSAGSMDSPLAFPALRLRLTMSSLPGLSDVVCLDILYVLRADGHECITCGGTPSGG